MLRWGILAIVIVVFVFWLRRGRSQNDASDADAKEVDQNRFYVNPDSENDPPPDDDKSNEL